MMKEYFRLACGVPVACINESDAPVEYCAKPGILCVATDDFDVNWVAALSLDGA